MRGAFRRGVALGVVLHKVSGYVIGGVNYLLPSTVSCDRSDLLRRCTGHDVKHVTVVLANGG